MPRRMNAVFLPVAIALLMAVPQVKAQGSAASPACGKAKVHMANPLYLTLPQVIVAIEPPQGWVLDQSRKNPFYLLKTGEKYNTARTLIYINIQRLDGPFQSAVENDESTFKESCKQSRIEDVDQLEILEQGCQRKTQIFRCEKPQGGWVDLATKISIDGLLLNVVLSADNMQEIARYRKDYEHLLKHLALAAR
jgi:hypothetical protein